MNQPEANLKSEIEDLPAPARVVEPPFTAPDPEDLKRALELTSELHNLFLKMKQPLFLLGIVDLGESAQVMEGVCIDKNMVPLLQSMGPVGALLMMSSQTILHIKEVTEQAEADQTAEAAKNPIIDGTAEAPKAEG